MDTLGTIREFHTGQFTVIVDALPDPDGDLSFDETGEIMADIESGDLILFAARARVIHRDLGEIASDYLGSCIYKNFDAFMDHKECGVQNKEWAARGDRARCGSYFSDMVATVCSEARQAIDAAHGIKVRA